ncbi:MAG: hypothetical protein NTY87_11090 [Planctomycetia bacterium]|nr:hypothetical protein [Planctomycetia bacterium]
MAATKPSEKHARAMQPARLPVTFKALGWTSFLTDLSSEAIYPLLPAFVGQLGGSAISIGLIDGVANAVAAIVRPPARIEQTRYCSGKT